MRVFGIAGWSGSGKTTLLARLIPDLLGRGLTISTVQHAHHTFDIDNPGKDSNVHREAGATEVLISSVNRWALLHENRDERELNLNEMLAKLNPVDLVLVEGFKHQPHNKLEVYRKSIGKPLLQVEDNHVRAIASDSPIPEATVPVLDLNDIPSIGDFVILCTELRASL